FLPRCASTLRRIGSEKLIVRGRNADQAAGASAAETGDMRRLGFRPGGKTYRVAQPLHRRRGRGRRVTPSSPRTLAVAAAVLLAGAATAFAGFSLADGRADALPTTDVSVGIREWAFDISRETAPVGTVVFTITNTGQSEPHDFAIDSQTSAVL